LVLLHYRQARIEKKEKCRARLENEKQQILKKLSEKIINKFEPITKQIRSCYLCCKKRK
jgi:hypothetical protein